MFGLTFYALEMSVLCKVETWNKKNSEIGNSKSEGTGNLVIQGVSCHRDIQEHNQSTISYQVMGVQGQASLDPQLLLRSDANNVNILLL